MTEKITVNAHAKINLTLHITGRLDSGYHTLKTVMQSISLCDTVTVSVSESKSISITCSDPSIPTDGSNIAYKAAEAFFKAANTAPFGVNIHIEKRIPSQAGLGGGSADGAAVFSALNALSGYPLTEEQLCEASASVGADIPFCLKGGTVLCEGIGDIMSPLPSLPDCFIVIGKGDEGISTKEAYEKIDSLPQTADFDFDVSIFSGNIAKIASHCKNVFEKAAPLDDVRRIKGLMIGTGALCSVMSGSGSAVYGLFNDSSSAEETVGFLSEDGYFSALCTPVSCGLTTIT